MNTLEVLTLVLVIFAALSYIDDHNNKKDVYKRQINTLPIRPLLSNKKRTKSADGIFHLKC